MAGMEEHVKELVIQELKTYRVIGKVEIPPDKTKEFETNGLEMPRGIAFHFETILEVKKDGGFGIIVSSIKLPPTVEVHLVDFIAAKVRGLQQKD